MGSTLTARVPDELNEALDQISEDEKLDKSAITRKLLEKAVRDYRIEEALNYYSEGELTLRQAAEKADMNLWQFIDRMSEEGVELQYSEEDFEEDVQAVRDE